MPTIKSLSLLKSYDKSSSFIFNGRPDGQTNLVEKVLQQIPDTLHCDFKVGRC